MGERPFLLVPNRLAHRLIVAFTASSHSDGRATWRSYHALGYVPSSTATRAFDVPQGIIRYFFFF